MPTLILQSSQASAVVRLTDTEPTLGSNEISNTRITQDLPAIFQEWNIEGQIQFSHSIGSLSTCQLSFTTTPDKENQIREYFAPYRLLTLYNHSYWVTALEIEHLPLPQTLKITISCGEPNSQRNPYNRPILLKQNDQNLHTYLHSLCEALGLSYTGPSIPLKPPKDLANDSTTTINDELSRAHQYGYFWQPHPDQLILKPFGSTPQRTLKDSDILQLTYSLNHPGDGAKFEGIPLTKEYHNTRLTLDNSGQEQQTNQTETIIDGDPNPHIPPNINKQLLYSPRLAFDTGGPTKTKKTITLLNGQPIKETETTFGFLYTSLDTHTVSISNGDVAIRRASLDFSSFWGQVSAIERIYVRNNDGYLLQISASGTLKTRFLQESDQLEQAIAMGERLFVGSQNPTEYNRLTQQINLYEYFNQPLSENRLFTLSPLDIFPDTPKQTPTPYYTSRDQYIFDSYAETPNPDSTTEAPLPPLSTGKYSQSETLITITRIPNPSAYRISNRTSNSEGAALSSSAAIENSQIVQGRPNLANRLQLYENNAPPTEDTPTEKNYRLRTPNSLPIEKNPDSLSFPGADTIGLAITAAETLCQIENSQNACTTTLKIKRKPSWQVGDRILWKDQIWWLLEIQESQSIHKNLINCSQFQIKIGRLLLVPITYSLDT